MEATRGQTNRALVVTGGDEWSGPLPQFGSAIDRVVAADSGIELALQLGLPVDTVVGDLDSASTESLREAQRLGATLQQFPVDKDETDLELAMDIVCADGAKDVVVLGGAGGRLSHLIGIATLLGSPKYAAVKITWLLPHAEVHVATPRRVVSVAGTVGDLISLIPVGEDATGINTTGLKWILHDETLTTNATRGISNEMLAERAEISLTAGTLLVIHEDQTQ